VHFYNEKHGIIYEALTTLQAQGSSDVTHLIQHLKKNGKLEDVGGVYYINDLMNIYSNTSNIEQYALIIQEKYLMRELANITLKTASKSFDDTEDVFDLISDTMSDITDLVDSVSSRQDMTISELINEYNERLIDIASGKVMGITTFLPTLTDYFGGWQGQRSYILAGRPGMGKSAIIMNDINYQLLNGKSVLLFNLEMTNTDLVSRILGLRIHEPQSELNKGKINNYEIYKNERDILATDKLYISDKNRLTDIILKSKFHKSKHNIDIIYIDYLQLIRSDGQNNRHGEVGYISRTIKQLAKDLNVPIISLAQLSRSVESRGGAKIPLLSDLKESGDIEQDADAVMFAYRPDYYGITQTEDGTPAHDLLQLIVAKNRSGQTGVLDYNWNGRLNLISENKEVKDLL
jgi:replicative DNA helicase